MKKRHEHLLPLQKRANLDANLVLLRADINVVGIFCWMQINPSARVHAPAFQQPFIQFLIQSKYSRLKSQLGSRVIQEVVKNRAAAAAHLICSLPSVG